MSKCKKCGGCCSGLILEIYEHDLIREPKLREFARLMDGDGNGGKIEFESDFDREYALPTPCPMLNEDNQCSIYPTRPYSCVAFNIGGKDQEKCDMVAKVN